MTPINTAQVDAATPEFFRVTAAVKYSGFSRSHLYVLMNSGQIKSRLIRKPGAISGSRIISRASIDALIRGAE